jgi:hypothetical protein
MRILLVFLLSFNALARHHYPQFRQGIIHFNFEKFMLTNIDVNKQAFSLHNQYRHDSVTIWNDHFKLIKDVDYVLSDISEVTWVTVFAHGPSAKCGDRPMREGNFIKVKGLLK